jgi:hypothetical protein
MLQNPYAAPAAGYGAPYSSHSTGDYVALGWRTTVAALAIASAPVFSFLVDIFQMVSGQEPNGEDGNLVVTLLLGVSGLGLLVVVLAGAVFFGIWLHRAFRNLRGLGRAGMVYTPGRAVASFYIPFINFVRPHRALTELWRASEPGAEADGAGWSAYGATTPLISLWWGFWLGSQFMGNASARIDAPGTSGAIGLVGSALMAVAAFACIRMMRGIVKRQEAAAARLAVAH